MFVHKKTAEQCIYVEFCFFGTELTSIRTRTYLCDWFDCTYYDYNRWGKIYANCANEIRPQQTVVQNYQMMTFFAANKDEGRRIFSRKSIDSILDSRNFRFFDIFHTYSKQLRQFNGSVFRSVARWNGTLVRALPILFNSTLSTFFSLPQLVVGET